MVLPLIPVVFGVASAVAGAVGVKKGLDAKKRLEEAKEIGEGAERRHRRAIQDLEKKQAHAYERLRALGEMKVTVFENTAKATIDLIKNARAQVQVHEFNLGKFPADELAGYERDLAQISAVDVTVDAGRSAALAALGATGTYGAVASLASASTGTAIATLSGAAASNATLAWLGGGSLAAGGLGVAGGTWVLGGVIAGPALAIAGFSLASRAEESVTAAQAYAEEVRVKIAELRPIEAVLDAVSTNVDETESALRKLQAAFDRGREEYQTAIARMGRWSPRLIARFSAKRREREAAELEHRLARLIAVFKAIKEVVQTPLLDDRQMPMLGIQEKFARLLEVADAPIRPSGPAVQP